MSLPPISATFVEALLASMGFIFNSHQPVTGRSALGAESALLARSMQHNDCSESIACCDMFAALLLLRWKAGSSVRLALCAKQHK
jgi:hypothetical protein